MQDMKQVYDYLNALRASGRKESTLHNYEKILTKLLRILGESGRPTRAEDITPEDIKFLYRTLTTKEEVTKMNLRALAGMIIHYTGKDVVKQACLLFNRANYSRRFLEDREVGELYRAGGPIERMVIVLGAFMGLRREEMAKIKDEDIRDGRLLIHGKGHTDRGFEVEVDIPPTVMREMEIYREWKSEYMDGGDGYFLQTVSAKTRNRLRRMTGSNIAQRLRVLGERTGIHVSPHALRRYFATTLYYKADCDIKTTAAILRHADVGTTFQCYIRPCDDKRKAAESRLDAYVLGIISEA